MTLTTPPQGPSDETYVTKLAVTSFPPSEQNDGTRVTQGLDQEALARIVREAAQNYSAECSTAIGEAEAKYITASVIAQVSPLLEERDRELAACRGREEGKQLVINHLEAEIPTRDARIKALEEGLKEILTTSTWPDHAFAHAVIRNTARALLNPSTVEGKEDV